MMPLLLPDARRQGSPRDYNNVAAGCVHVYLAQAIELERLTSPPSTYICSGAKAEVRSRCKAKVLRTRLDGRFVVRTEICFAAVMAFFSTNFENGEIPSQMQWKIGRTPGYVKVDANRWEIKSDNIEEVFALYYRLPSRFKHLRCTRSHESSFTWSWVVGRALYSTTVAIFMMGVVPGPTQVFFIDTVPPPTVCFVYYMFMSFFIPGEYNIIDACRTWQFSDHRFHSNRLLRMVT